MRRKLSCLILILFIGASSYGQSFKLYGKVVNQRLEPLAFATVEIRDIHVGTTTREDGSYELKLDGGKYDMVVTMLGYKPALLTVIVQKNTEQNVILEMDDSKALEEVRVRGKIRDRAEEIIRNVISGKEKILDAAGAYSCDAYIRATQEDSSSIVKKQKGKDTIALANRELAQMAMAEVTLHVDYSASGKIKEERTGVKKRGNPQSLFYLSATEGDFNLYNNLIKVPAVSEIPFISPISYSGLIAYRYKTLGIEIKDGHKYYTIGIRPREMSNATVEGQVIVMDSAWVLTEANYSLPGYHLPEYDHFNIDQQYSFVKDTAWMISRQTFTYSSKWKKSKTSGSTMVVYKDFELNRSYPKNYFGTELSATAQEAYEKDSIYWAANRTEPLTDKELRFIRYKDSIYSATHSEAYLDSVDRVTNKVTWKNVLFFGQTFNDHKKERRWFIPPLPTLYQPIQFGGTRIYFSFDYFKTYPSKKNIALWNNISYGIRNHDVNGFIRFNKLYNPFNRGSYNIRLERSFAYIFQGDAWINMLKRSNTYLNNGLGFGHNLELFNGFFLFTDVDIAFRRSVSDYKTNPQVDSLLGDVLTNNQAVYFDPYNALYGKIRLQYTPFQRYIREPKEKVILGSKFPTFYTMWRKGIPGILNSKVDFDYLEFGMEQRIELGTAGISSYTVKTGTFLSKKDLRLVDYKFQRQGDPFLFLNPNEAFQALDSTFPVFKRFYEAHYVHEFNGFFINKVPLLKKLGLREVAGAGFLVAPERDLRYGELFIGVERVFKWPFNPMTKFKIGVYVTGSVANQFRNPVQFKIGITSWDKIRNRWF